MTDVAPETAGKWCILRTSGPRTLKLAQSLAAAGFEVWTPVRTIRQTGRGRKRKEVVLKEVPLAPCLIFARAVHGLDLLRLRREPASRFDLLRDENGVALVRDAALNGLRAAEERFRRSLLKSTRRQLVVGSSIRLTSGGFAGMSGVVKQGRKGKAVVDLGGIFGEVEIASYLVESDVVSPAASPNVGLAA